MDDATNPPKGRRTLDIIEAEAGGDVGRVIVAGVRPLPGPAAADTARFLREEADGLRQILTQHPHGDLTQCINLVVPPSAPDADAGLVIMGTMGYPGFSGSNAMCALAALVECGRLALPEEAREVALETPGGVTRLTLRGQDGRVDSVAYTAPTGRELARQRIPVPGFGEVETSIIDGGTIYAVVDAAAVGLDPASTRAAQIAEFFGALLAAMGARNPGEGAVPLPSLGLLASSPRPVGERTEAAVAVYMAGGVICRGPTGTGSTALLTWLQHRGAADTGTVLDVRSPYGYTFTATMTGHDDSAPARVHTRITGRPRLLGRTRLFLEDGDPLLDRHRLAQLLEPPA